MPQPTDRDMMVVQDKLAELYATLTPAQRDVLDTIMAAGLSFVEEDDDLSGYQLIGGLAEADAHVRSRMAELKEDWRRANTRFESDSASEESRLQWGLRPLLDWFHRPQRQTT